MQQINYNLLPEHIRGGMKRYIEQGIIPGDFLQAIIQDKLVDSFERADETNITNMFNIAKFAYNEMPMGSRGSEETMFWWHEIGGLNGLLAKKATKNNHGRKSDDGDDGEIHVSK